MKTKPTQHPATASFPTCGEVFEFLINALDLPAWNDLFLATSDQDKGRAKVISDKLRDWACEPDDRVPSRGDFNGFIRSYTECIPHRDALRRILERFVNRVLDEHTNTIRENATYLAVRKLVLCLDAATGERGS